MVGVPELANEPSGRVEVRDIGAVVRKVAGVGKVSEVLRLPESVALQEVMARVDPQLPRADGALRAVGEHPGSGVRQLRRQPARGRRRTRAVGAHELRSRDDAHASWPATAPMRPRSS